jgi:hypothetical protein
VSYIRLLCCVSHGCGGLCVLEGVLWPSLCCGITFTFTFTILMCLKFDFPFRQQATVRDMRQEHVREMKHITWRDGLEKRGLLRRISGMEQEILSLKVGLNTRIIQCSINDFSNRSIICLTIR